CTQWVLELATTYPWDFLLGAVHHIGDFPIDRRAADWEGQDVETRWRQYFTLWAEAATSGLFDSLAHPDLPKKFNFRPATDFTEVYRETLAAVARAGVAIEISTAGLRKPCQELYPSESFLRIAREFDIPITIGSDAHSPEETGADLEHAVMLAKRCGYHHVCRFTQRRREFVPL
ncbi:MAG: PHP domain-containing protein, partial [Verrucomicrobiae bacterium]|nr:PHP domain-containing protein [Verrucomicrobiae bacterium]